MDPFKELDEARPRFPGRPVPDFQKYFSDHLGTDVMGYAYCAAYKGVIIDKGFSGLLVSEAVGRARAKQDKLTEFFVPTRMNIASVSKSVTAVAVLKALNAEKDPDVINKDFFPLMASSVPDVQEGNSYFKGISVADLLRMRSGLELDGQVYFEGLSEFLTDYLKREHPLRAQKSYLYNNANFAICQAIVNCATNHDDDQLGHWFSQYVFEKVLEPMGTDKDKFNADPDDKSHATLCYGGTNDTKNGRYWLQMQNVAAGGFISTVEEVMKFLIGVRNYTILDEKTTNMMLDKDLGWYTAKDPHGFGDFHYHNGALWTIDPKENNPANQSLSTSIARSKDGYDLVLFINSGKNAQWLNADIFTLGAFGAKPAY